MEPYFYLEDLSTNPGSEILLDENASRHCVLVLRMEAGERIKLTNGKGDLCTAAIITPHRKHCGARILETVSKATHQNRGFGIAIAFTKNNTRNEWLLEKITELGVSDIYPIITEHSEKVKFNVERYNKILAAAMIQSQQCFLPILHEAEKLNIFLEQEKNTEAQKLIAHCNEGEKQSLSSVIHKDKKCLMLIGPEGDFSVKETELCQEFGFIPVHLGKNRLRTETAALYACSVYNSLQDS